MKNYPLLTVNNKNRFYHWRNNYVTPLLNQVKDLSYYSYFIEPPYREFKSTWEPGSEITDYNIIDGTTFHYENMPVHSYLQLTSQMTVDSVILPAGTWVVSEARDEGTTSLVSDFSNYIYMPGGYGSFYVLTDIIYNEITTEYDMLFTYLRNAGEVYGYSPKSNLIFNTNRFALKPSNISLQFEQKGKAVHSNILGRYLNTGTDENPIWNTFTEWYTLGTPMHFCFNSTGEEIILDETHVINLEEANTHSYTINSKHNDVRAFYVDFI